MKRTSISAALLSLVALAALLVGPGPASLPSASAHAVTCLLDSQQPFFNNLPDPNRGTLQGAVIIECSPTAPDSQRTEVQLQWEKFAGEWTNRGDPYVSHSNARFHRQYDSTHCKLHEWDYWRTRGKHTGTHHDTATKSRYSYFNYLYCHWNNS